MRKLLAIAALTLLSACFASEEPLYAESDGACPFMEATTLGVAIVDAGGEHDAMPAISIAPEGRYCRQQSLLTRPSLEQATSNESGPHDVLYIALQPGWWITQTESTQSERSGYSYGLARLVEGRLTLFQPNCADFTIAALEEMDIAFSNPMGELQQAVAQAEGQSEQSAEPAPASQGANIVCSPSERGQLEAAFRAWIDIGRAAQTYIPMQ